MNRNNRIVITGGAGLVGQNLVVALLERGYRQISVIDKSVSNLAILQQLHPQLETCPADLAEPGAWQELLVDADVILLLHAQIGGLFEEEFERNNVISTQNLLEGLRGNRDCYLVHVSSSVIHSTADDFYTRSKTEQERLIRESGHPWIVLRPTLMFGWFDRKHFGWLSRFMKRVPVFPIPGSGNYLRQPLYVGDFCNILIACLEQRLSGECVNISGKEKVPYIEVIRQIRRAVGARSLLMRIPVCLFALLLRSYALFDRNPPFTVQQLEALVIDEIFEDIDWEGRFGVTATPLQDALRQTFSDPRYSHIVLEF